MSLTHILLLCTAGIRPEHDAFGLHLMGKSIQGGRQSADVVAFAAQSFQEVIHRGDNLHATGQQCILAWPLEIADGDTLVLVPLGAQRQLPFHMVDKSTAAFQLSRTAVVTPVVLILCSYAIGSDTTINLWNHNARVFRSCRHGVALIHPLLVRH